MDQPFIYKYRPKCLKDFEMDKKFSIDIDTQEDISKFLFNNKDLL